MMAGGFRIDLGLAGVTLAALSPDLGAEGVARTVALFDLHLFTWWQGGRLVYVTAPHVIALLTLAVLLGRTLVAMGAHAHECARRRALRDRYARRQQSAADKQATPSHD